LHNSFLDQSLKVASTIIDLDKKNGEFNQTMHVRSYKKRWNQYYINNSEDERNKISY